MPTEKSRPFGVSAQLAVVDAGLAAQRIDRQAESSAQRDAVRGRAAAACALMAGVLDKGGAGFPPGSGRPSSAAETDISSPKPASSYLEFLELARIVGSQHAAGHYAVMGAARYQISAAC